MRSWPERRHVVAALAAAGIVVLGIAAEHQRSGWSETHDWVPDLLVGWTLAGLGLAAFLTARPRGAAALLVVAGVTWFAGNFYATGPDWLASASSQLSWLFLTPLVQLALAFPTGRPRTRIAWIGVAGAWVAALLGGLSEAGARERAAALAAVTLVGAWSWLRSSGGARRDAAWGLVPLLALVGWAIASPRLDALGSWDQQALLLDAAVLFAGVWLFAGLPSPARLVTRAIELDEATGTLELALARLLDDPDLKVGFDLDGSRRYVDDHGLVVTPDGRRVATTVADDGVVVATIVHDPLVLARDDDRRAVSTAVRLAARRTRLREEARIRTEEVAASATRLLQTEDDARARLAARLEAGPLSRLEEARSLLEEVGTGAAPALARSREQLAHAEEELVAFASGLGGLTPDAELPSELARLVDGLPLDVSVRVADGHYPPALARSAWFVCAEGVANVLKHAHATRLDVEVVRTNAALRVTVADDGRGGVDPDGSGISGLRDRVAAHGGSLHIASDAAGTRLVAEFPLDPA
jgi:signal transduction histidine kinase